MFPSYRKLGLIARHVPGLEWPKQAARLALGTIQAEVILL